jgi:hypothetical protein
VKSEKVNSREAKAECNECGKVYKSKVALYNHRKAAHATGDDVLPTVHRCTTCGEQFGSSAALRRHKKEKEHNWTPAKRIPCTKCERTFSLKNSLR